MCASCSQIAHDAARYEQCLVFPEQCSHSPLQFSDGRIFTEYVVADFRVCHRLTHCRGRFCYGIASKVDNIIGHVGFLIFLFVIG